MCSQRTEVQMKFVGGGGIEGKNNLIRLTDSLHEKAEIRYMSMCMSV